MTSHSNNRPHYRQLLKRGALALALGLAVAGGIAWQGTGLAGRVFEDIAVNWRGKGDKDDCPPNQSDLAVNWRGRDGGTSGAQSIMPPPAS